MVNWRSVAEFLGAAAIFVGGYQYAAAQFGEDIAALREDYAARALALEEKYRAKEQENARAVIVAWEERDRALRDAVSLRDELGGVRDEAAALRRQLSRAPSDSCKPFRTALGECTSLLSRSAELLERGAREYQELAADHDAIVKLK